MFLSAGPSLLTVHLEAAKHIHRALQRLSLIHIFSASQAQKVPPISPAAIGSGLGTPIA